MRLVEREKPGICVVQALQLTVVKSEEVGRKGEKDSDQPVGIIGSPERVGFHITYPSELNEAEQENIARAQDWALGRRRDLLTEKFTKDLHRHMLGDVWRWAGKFRITERNLGIPPNEIPVALRHLLDDARAWIAHEAYPRDEIAVRLHHRLVHIHPFPNGNGRHSRLMADLLVMSLDGERFSWGSASLRNAGDMRRRYVAALQAADNHDVGPLLTFARS